MKVFSMSGSLRENVGKKEAKKNRREGQVPCVLYGGEKQIHFTVSIKELDKILFTPEVYLVELTIDGKLHKAIVKDLQYHPITDLAIHVDFQECFEGKKITVGLPVYVVGSAKGVIKGGRVLKRMRKIVVNGLLEHIPDAIEVDISPLDIGQGIRIRDLAIDKLTFVDPASSMVVGVKSARGVSSVDAEEEEGEEEAAE